MNDKVKSFMEYVSSHEELKAELKTELTGKDKGELTSNIIRFAKKHGYELTNEDFTGDAKELTPEELEAVSAGAGCICALGGFGQGDGLDCMCIALGYGSVGKDNLYINSQGGCLCTGGGAGATRRH